MNNIEEIKIAIESLPDSEYSNLRKWFTERDWKRWDLKIEKDSKSEKLDFLIAEALEAKKAGVLKTL